MPKVRKRIRSAALGEASSSTTRHEPLGQVIQDDQQSKIYASRRSFKQPKTNANKQEESYLDERSSRKIRELSELQKLEIQAEQQQQASSRGGRQQMDSDDDDDSEQEELLDRDNDTNDDDAVDVNNQGYVTITEEQLSPEDQALIDNMMGGDNNNSSNTERQTLADKILEKIQQKEQQQAAEQSQQQQQVTTLPPKVVQVYTEIGKILSRYTSGKLPKAYKVIPSLSNWEEILYLTRPDNYTPQAMYMATRIFASNLNPKMAQRFYKLVLLDAIRDDIATHKKLNYHLYMALKKTVYKPAAFFKGILFPLIESDCTLREAGIVASVLQRVSIPVHHSAVALHKLAQLNFYSPSLSIFIKTLLNKKYSLPAPVISSLVQHFCGFVNYREQKQLPVLWHQALLVFVQRYKSVLVDNNIREQLRLLLKTHFHAKITPEIRRELFGAQAYQEERRAMELE